MIFHENSKNAHSFKVWHWRRQTPPSLHRWRELYLLHPPRDGWLPHINVLRKMAIISLWFTIFFFSLSYAFCWYCKGPKNVFLKDFWLQFCLVLTSLLLICIPVSPCRNCMLNYSIHDILLISCSPGCSNALLYVFSEHLYLINL